MGYTLHIGAEDARPLASITGLKELRGYVETLPLATFTDLKHLLEYGYSEQPESVRSQVQHAVTHGSHPSEDVSATLQDMAKSLAAIPNGASVVFISDDLS